MILCLDIGGSKISAGLVKKNKIFHFQKFNWQGKTTRQNFLKQVFEIISNFKLRYSSLRAIAVSVAGQVNHSGEVVLSRNIIKKKTKVSLKKILEKKFRFPVIVENDTNCFTLAEAVYGRGKGKNLVVGLTLGTGIGGGLVFNKKIVYGKNGYAAELGHMIIRAGGKKCSCGKRGCFEAYASVTGLRNFYYQLSGKKVSGLMIDQTFQKKDKKATEAAERVVKYLSIGLGNIVNIFDPEIVVLGGGLVRFDWLIKKAILKTEQTIISNQKRKIFTSKLEDKAPLVGASLLISKQA